MSCLSLIEDCYLESVRVTSYTIAQSLRSNLLEHKINLLDDTTATHKRTSWSNRADKTPKNEVRTIRLCGTVARKFSL